MTSGIYRIKNLETGAMYIGQTAQTFARRWGKHRSALKTGCHDNDHLQRSYDKHGKDAFEFKVLEVIPQGDMSNQEFSDYLNEREIRLIDKLDAFENGYNMSEGGRGTVGRTPWNKGKKLGPYSAEHRSKMSAARKGNINRLGSKATAETRAKMSAVRKGKPWTAARRAAHDANKEAKL